MPVEDGTNSEAHKVYHEKIRREDPPDLGGRVLLKLVLEKIRLEYGGCIDDTENGHEQTE